MCLQTNVVRRGAVYYARVGLPSDLLRARAKAGLSRKREVLRSLRTKDPKEAKRLGPQMVALLIGEFARELEQLRFHDPADGPASPRSLRSPTDTELEQAVWNLVRADLREDDVVRDQLPTAGRRDELRREVREAEARANQSTDSTRSAALLAALESIDAQLELDRASLRSQMREIEHETIKAEHPEDAFGHLAQAVIVDNGWDLLPGTPRFRHFCALLRAGRLRSLKALRLRDDGDILAPEANPLRDAPSPTVTPISAVRGRRGESLVDLLEVYLKEQAAGLSSEEVDKKKKVTELFAQHLGTGKPVRSIGRAELRSFKQALSHWPVTARNQKQFRGKTFPQIVEANKKLKLRTVKAPTINNYISALGAFFDWLHANGYHDEPRLTQGMLVKHDKGRTARKSYTDEELTTIFSLPLFIGASANDVRLPGETLIADWRFWIPLLCAYTGARLGEVAQLRTADVQVHGGHPVVLITDEGTDMTVKTKDSIRAVPLHHELTRLGFGEYVKQRIAAGDERLWPELELNRHGRYSGSVSKWWRQHLKHADISGNAYKFRHTFIDLLRRAGHLDHEIGPIVGHSPGSITHRYGNLPQVTLDRRATMIGDVSYPMVAGVPPRS